MSHNIKYCVQKFTLEIFFFSILLYINFFLPIIGTESVLFIIVFSLTSNFKSNFNIFIILISLLTDVLCENKFGMHIAVSLFIMYEMKSERKVNKRFSELFISFIIFLSIWLLLNIIILDQSKLVKIYRIENYISGIIFFPFINYLTYIIRKKSSIN